MEPPCLDFYVKYLGRYMGMGWALLGIGYAAKAMLGKATSC